MELSLKGGPMIAAVTLSATKGPYGYTTLGAEFAATDVPDLHLGLRGPVRLAHIGFSG
ncbi:hypothetical protein ACFWFF_40450 [Streptomyces sp. NPDC060223]|uniref:hypothetical protein n=1 Tax=unclassified Streptomyces TaxID=2593676 RepID=UPI0036407D50